jgi:hypothetical protein
VRSHPAGLGDPPRSDCYCLERLGVVEPDFEDFVEADIDNVLSLFGEFNEGTHGGVGRIGLRQLSALKRPVEDAIVFVHRICHLSQGA